MERSPGATEYEAVKDQNAGPNNSATEEPMLFCPVCSDRLASLRCKLVCERCGYFMSCADYY